MTDILGGITRWLAAQLDKLKVKSPFVFVGIQFALSLVTAAFVNGQFHLVTPTWMANIIDFNSLVTAFLVGLIAIISPRTSVQAAEFKANKAEKLEDKADEIKAESKETLKR
jgi:hypothetical protein